MHIQLLILCLTWCHLKHELLLLDGTEGGRSQFSPLFFSSSYLSHTLFQHPLSTTGEGLMQSKTTMTLLFNTYLLECPLGWALGLALGIETSKTYTDPRLTKCLPQCSRALSSALKLSMDPREISKAMASNTVPARESDKGDALLHGHRA